MLKGKAAVVTGSTSGIGLGIARGWTAKDRHLTLQARRLSRPALVLCDA